MTQQEYYFLSRFEKNFKTATESGYTKAIGLNDRKKIAEIAKRETGKMHGYNCYECLKTTLKALYPYYRDFGKNKNVEPVEAKTVVETKKRGRKKIK